MSDPRLTRRTFIAVAGAASVVGLAACGGGDSFVPETGPAVVYRLSTRGITSASNAAKSHAANKRFRTMAAADTNRAHPGDNSKVVPITVSRATYESWFGRGLATTDVTDLRL